MPDNFKCSICAKSRVEASARRLKKQKQVVRRSDKEIERQKAKLTVHGDQEELGELSAAVHQHEQSAIEERKLSVEKTLVRMMPLSEEVAAGHSPCVLKDTIRKENGVRNSTNNSEHLIDSCRNKLDDYKEPKPIEIKRI